METWKKAIKKEIEQYFGARKNTRQELRDSGREVIEEKMKKGVEAYIKPALVKTKARNGKSRSERERWDDIGEMVDDVEYVLDWAHWLDGIPSWYEPVFFQNGPVR